MAQKAFAMIIKRSRPLKCCSLFLFCIASAGVSLAQNRSEISPLPIEILKLKWEKQIRLPRNFDPSVTAANNSFDPAVRPPSTTPTPSIGGSVTSDQTRAATNARIGATDTPFPSTPGRLPVFYVYSLKIKNAGPKIITAIAWDYLFIDPHSSAELGRHQFMSFENVLADRAATLQGELRSTPIRVVQTSEAARNGRSKPVEKAEIQCVLYADDSIWRSTQAREGVCDLLRNRRPSVKRKRVNS
jgi:hypothetical protein